MQLTIDELIAWARQAGSILREGYGKPHEINFKSKIDLVTEMDRRSEAFLLQKIQTHFPNHSIYSEESGQIDGKESTCWYIDPLDGTTNYAHHIPHFAVSLAIAEGNDLVMGVIYDPMRDECFSAAKGTGAYLNGEKICVSKTDDLVYSVLATGFPYNQTISEKNIANFAHFMRRTQGVRRSGSAALDLCYVACGRYDGYWEITLQPYDLAAGALIAREAGAIVTNLEGNANLFLSPYAIIAGNPPIHGRMLVDFKTMTNNQEMSK